MTLTLFGLHSGTGETAKPAELIVIVIVIVIVILIIIETDIVTINNNIYIYIYIYTCVYHSNSILASALGQANRQTSAPPQSPLELKGRAGRD